ncbi:hypothetical protein [Serratia sp. CY37345]|uniref:hypothetical protein n=1 Tax=Serratia sp. CY37345 TaxID=3383610 RepID=UPI003FA117A2
MTYEQRYANTLCESSKADLKLFLALLVGRNASTFEATLPARRGEPSYSIVLNIAELQKHL